MTIPVRQPGAGPFVAGMISVILVVSGCVTQPEPPPVPSAVPAGIDTLERIYREAAGRGERVFRIDRGESFVRIFVYRAGVLARLGHDHAVTGHQIHGYMWLPAEGAARVDLYLAVAELIVDEPEAREAAGFTTEPTDADRDGTYRNMLASLDADRYPTVLLHAAIPMSGPLRDINVRVTAVDLTLHGTTRRLTVPAHVITTGDRFRVTGTFRIRQSDFGITPFSVFGGALSVRDELELHFDLVFSEL